MSPSLPRFSMLSTWTICPSLGSAVTDFPVAASLSFRSASICSKLAYIACLSPLAVTGVPSTGFFFFFFVLLLFPVECFGDDAISMYSSSKTHSVLPSTGASLSLPRCFCCLILRNTSPSSLSIVMATASSVAIELMLELVSPSVLSVSSPSNWNCPWRDFSPSILSSAFFCLAARFAFLSTFV